MTSRRIPISPRLAVLGAITPCAWAGTRTIASTTTATARRRNGNAGGVVTIPDPVEAAA